jgi:hypothetical protein
MNRRRPSLLALPAGVKLADFDFEPTKEELKQVRALQTEARRAELNRQAALKRLARLKQSWEEKERGQRKRRIKELEAAIAADKKWIAEQDERERQRMDAEAQTKRVADYYIAEEHRALLIRLSKATAAVNRDIIRTERKELERRGVIRGKRQP